MRIIGEEKRELPERIIGHFKSIMCVSLSLEVAVCLYYSEHYLDILGNERPQYEYLIKFVRDKVCAACANNPEKWRDLGIELIGQQKVDIIKANNGDVTQRCSVMLSLWLEIKSKASWNQLIQALKDVELETLADEVHKLLLPCVEQELIDNQPKIEQHDEGMYMHRNCKLMQ